MVTHTELAIDAKKFLEQLAAFENNCPRMWGNLSEMLYSKTDLNITDLVNLLEAFSEILG